MRAPVGLGLVAAALLLSLTALLLQGAAPDAALHQRTMTALHDLVLDDAALQRDVLKARAGLLPNYDSLVRAVDRLRAEAAGLREASRIAEGAAAAGIAERHAALTRAVLAQESAVEAFKSDNALLQNSLRYFAHVAERLGAALADAAEPRAGDIAALAGAMLHLLAAPGSPDVEALIQRLDRLQAWRGEAAIQAELEALERHGRLIAAKLPVLDATVAQLLATPIAARAGALQASYLEQHAKGEARATWSRGLLYAASVGLLAWLVLLVLRLRARLHFEKLVAGIAAGFIDLPRERLGEGVTAALAALARQLGADRARARLAGGDGRDFHWQGADVPATAQPRARLHIALRRGEADAGWLTFEAMCRRRWDAHDRALLRAAGEILAGAVERDRAAAERDSLEASLRQAQRMEAVGTLAGGIAHDFNNILGAILGYAEMALEALPPGNRIREHVRQIHAAGGRARGVVDRILAFSRRDEPELRPLRLHAVCAEAAGLLRASLPASVVLSLDVVPGAEAAVVHGDAARLQVVVLNLCTNGAQAMDGQGTLTLALDEVATDGPRELSHGTLPAGRHVRLAVTDSGHGIDAATAQRIFEPFFTTRRPGHGTGLGLATTWAIVADHGGVVNLRSRPGEGSTFEVYLPRIEAAAEEEEGDAAPLPGGEGEAVLLVDDERPLVLLGEEMLASLGYEPVGFASAGEALAAVRADPARFDLVLTDEAMPEMTGTQLAAALHGIRPDLPVVLMTGFAGPVRAERLRAAGIAEVLRKPLSTRAIAESLGRHLRARRQRVPDGNGAALQP